MGLDVFGRFCSGAGNWTYDDAFHFGVGIHSHLFGPLKIVTWGHKTSHIVCKRYSHIFYLLIILIVSFALTTLCVLYFFMDDIVSNIFCS